MSKDLAAELELSPTACSAQRLDLSSMHSNALAAYALAQHAACTDTGATARPEAAAHSAQARQCRRAAA